MITKEFKYRSDMKNNIALKEYLYIVDDKDKHRIKVTFTIKKDLTIGDPFIQKTGVFFPLVEYANELNIDMLKLLGKRVKELKHLYFPINEDTMYIGELSLELNRGNIVKEEIFLYLPRVIKPDELGNIKVDKEGILVCEDITHTIKGQVREGMIKLYTSYALQRGHTSSGDI